MAAKVGLTGGIGSGKSTVAKHFSKLGVATINADDIARQLTKKGSQELEDMVETFGRKILAANGDLDRERMRALVFRSPSKRKTLERILHPAIRENLFRWAAACKDSYCILEVPLLFESDLYTKMDRTLCIICPTNIRIERVLNNRDIDEETLRKIINNQLSDQQRISKSDDIIDNTCSLLEMAKQVKTLHNQYLELFKETHGYRIH